MQGGLGSRHGRSAKRWRSEPDWHLREAADIQWHYGANRDKSRLCSKCQLFSFRSFALE